MNIVLPFPKNFKKCARWFTDDELKAQIMDIDTIRYIITESDDQIEPKLSNPLIKYYAPQLKWLYKYQMALLKEFNSRFGVDFLYVDDYRYSIRALESAHAISTIYGKQKWKPAAFFVDSNGNYTFITDNLKKVGKFYQGNFHEGKIEGFIKHNEQD